MSVQITEDTLDDAMKCALEKLLAEGEIVSPTKGACREIRGVLMEIKNPRARLSRSESRGHAFSCLGELCWYLSGSGELQFIEYYIPEYQKFSENEILFGAYGPRLFRNMGGIDQVESITSLLKRKQFSRQAVIQIFKAEDIIGEHKDVPCTCTFQFFLRNDSLEMITNMRSNDAYVGLSHDVFCFTMLQEILARKLGVELGVYRHFVGSLHLYEHNVNEARKYLNEGWQPTNAFMPNMPVGDPNEQIKCLIEFEAKIRLGMHFDLDKLSLKKYWIDLIMLLQIFHYSTKNKNAELVTYLCGLVDSSYAPYIDKMLARAASHGS